MVKVSGWLYPMYARDTTHIEEVVEMNEDIFCNEMMYRKDYYFLCHVVDEESLERFLVDVSLYVGEGSSLMVESGDRYWMYVMGEEWWQKGYPKTVYEFTDMEVRK